MRPESAGHQRDPPIQARLSQIPTVGWPSGPAGLMQPRGLMPAHSEPHQSSTVWENLEVGRRRSGRVGGEHVRAGDVGGGRRVSLDGGIPYLLLRGCCSVVRDCLELPPVPGIFEGNTKACDGPDLLELPFFYVSLHFLLCYTSPPPSFPHFLPPLLLLPLSVCPCTQLCLPITFLK